MAAKTNRVSVDLDPALLEAFDDWTTKTARANGRRSLAMTDALRVMIKLTVEDSDMSAAVETELLASKWAPR
jgi:metal-responsive CopG/Arc/MetJ family transcriptional regulator